MANALYPSFKQKLLEGDVPLDTTNIKALLVDLTEYTYNPAHDALADVVAGARVATSGNLSSKTFTGGTFDAADFSFTAVSGAEAGALIFYIDSGTESTSYLIAYFDTGVSGLPVMPNGGDIDVTLNASGVFAL